MIQKHFIDIKNLREETKEIAGVTICKNDTAFEIGDIVSITEKVDGSNASFRYDADTGKLIAFSRKKELNYANTLNGFYNYVQSLNADEFKDVQNLTIFGEWLVKNKIVYDAENVHKWYVYSVYDNDTQEWLGRDFVKAFCEEHGFTYVHEFYYGEFKGWEHCRSFTNSPHYGDTQEGVVVRNITALNNPDRYGYHILKIVNEDFKERAKMRTRERKTNDDMNEERKTAQDIIESLVTKNRVEKELYKMRDEGIIPDVLSVKDMSTIAKFLPKRMYDDLKKEDSELLERCGEYGGKICNSVSMAIARDIILPK